MPALRTNPLLKRKYVMWNKVYFGNKLPHDIVVAYADGRFDEEFATSRKRRKYGFSWKPTRYADRREKPMIVINKWLWRHRLWDQIFITLLHEMVHLYNWKAQHGEAFRQGVHRIAVLGALDYIV